MCLAWLRRLFVVFFAMAILFGITCLVALPVVAWFDLIGKSYTEDVSLTTEYWVVGIMLRRMYVWRRTATGADRSSCFVFMTNATI